MAGINVGTPSLQSEPGVSIEFGMGMLEEGMEEMNQRVQGQMVELATKIKEVIAMIEQRPDTGGLVAVLNKSRTPRATTANPTMAISTTRVLIG